MNTPKLLFFARHFVLCAVLLLATAAIHAEDRLFGDAQASSVRLAWSLTEWPAGTVGFAVKKRQTGGGWQAVTTVYPEISTTTDWASREPETSRHAFLIELLNHYVEQGVAPSERDAFIAQLQSQPELLAGLYREAHKNYDLALLAGFGAVDRLAAPIDAIWEYAIFSVANDPVGTVASAPLASVLVRPETAAPFNWEMDLTAAGGATQAQLSWDLSASLGRQWGIVGFVVRRLSGAGAPEDLVLNPICEPVSRSAETRCAWNVTSTTGSEVLYGVTAVNFFGRELASATVLYNFKAQTAYVPQRPTDLSATVVPGGVELTWRFEAADRANILGYRVQRAQLGGTEFIDASPLLATDVLSFSDTNLATSGTIMYQIVARDDRYGDRVSDTVLVLLSDPNKPAAATNLLIALVPPERCFGNAQDPTSGFWCKSSWKLSLNWQPPENSPAQTAGYQLYADLFAVGKVERLNSAPLQDTSHVETMGQCCRASTWRVASISPTGVESDFVEAAIYVPMGKLPSIALSTITATTQDSDSVVAWEYPAISDLAGFRLYRLSAEGPQLLLDEAVITQDLRTITLKTPELQTGTVHYYLQAVSKFAGIRTELAGPRKLE